MIRTQRNAWIHLFATLGVVTCGIVFQIQRTDWLWVVAAAALVWTAEALNTAIECVSDAVAREPNERVKTAKDTAAGAVLLASVGAAVIGVMVFYPYIFLDARTINPVSGRVSADVHTVLFTADDATPVCASVRFWTPHPTADHIWNRGKARRQLHDVLIAFGGGYTIFEVDGGWKNGKTNEIETEPGLLYESMTTDCRKPQLLESTLKTLRTLITAEDYFDQDAVFISTTRANLDGPLNERRR